MLLLSLFKLLNSDIIQCWSATLHKLFMIIVVVCEVSVYSAFSATHIPIFSSMHQLQAGSRGRQDQGISKGQDSSRYSLLVAYWEGVTGQSIKFRN